MSRHSKLREHCRCPCDYTCPYIDEAVAAIEDAISYGLHADVAYEITQQLEHLREMNDELRLWGVEEATSVDRLNDAAYTLRS